MLSPRTACRLVLALAFGCLPAVAQISNIDPNQITTNGSAQVLMQGEGGPAYIQLTQDGVDYEAGSAWWNNPQPVGNGFTTVFQFQVTHTTGGAQADGLAFVIQNCVSNCGESGPLVALGGTGGDIGYGVQAGEEASSIDNSIAIEFDTYQNGWDPNANHVAVQSCGTANNTPDHTLICPSGHSSNLGIAPMPGINISDGNPHTVILQYDPGVLSIFIDNSQIPILVVNVDLGQLLNLIPLDNGPGAYVGFTGGTGAGTQTGNILSWTFTPGGSMNPTMITQTLTPGPGDNFTSFVFGSYNHKYEYTGANAGDTVTVTAMPNSPSYVNGLISTFPPGTAMCIPYDGTGGDCVIFGVSCTETTGNDCATLPYTLYENYNTNQQISSPCLLKTESLVQPITWTNIETSFSELRFDPVSTGKSNGFSYFVVAQNCSPTQPAQNLRGNNCNGTYSGIYHGNLTVSAGQSCIFTGGGVSGNLTQSGGSLVLQGSSSVGGNLTMTGGTFSISTQSKVTGNLQISGPSSFAVGPNVTVGGNLLVQNIPAAAGTNQVCGTTVQHGNLTVTNSGVATQVGSTSTNICPGNSVSGNLTVQTNSGQTAADSNTVGGNLVDQNNAGATGVFSNTIHSNLECSGNSSITGGGNTAHAKTGQCVSF